MLKKKNIVKYVTEKEFFLLEIKSILLRKLKFCDMFVKKWIQKKIYLKEAE